MHIPCSLLHMHDKGRYPTYIATDNPYCRYLFISATLIWTWQPPFPFRRPQRSRLSPAGFFSARFFVPVAGRSSPGWPSALPAWPRALTRDAVLAAIARRFSTGTVIAARPVPIKNV